MAKGDAAKLDWSSPVTVARFEKRYKRGKVGECWAWLGASANCGYGSFRYMGRNRNAHRVAYMIANKVSLIRSQVVRHKCDNTPCVNPAHLEVGTMSDNTQDMMKRGRHRSVPPKQGFGENNTRAKLSTKQAIESHRLRDAGFKIGAIAEKMKVSRSAMSNLLSGLNWPHIYRAVRGENASKTRPRRRR